MAAPVEIVGYDPSWPGMYESEKDLILRVIGQRVEAIEHVGSTSVPGLGAKAIIDIMAAVPRLDHAPALVEPLASIGYEYLPEYEKFVPERRYFRKGSPEPDSHHLHIVERSTAFWKDHVLFRDFLRAHPAWARRYEAHKRDLSVNLMNDPTSFTEAKTGFIVEALASARRWRDGAASSPPA